MKTEDKLKKATTTLIMRFPFWAAMRFRLKTNFGRGPDYITPTAATDGSTLFFNEDFCEPLNQAEFLGLVIHELGHVVLLHHLRRGNRNPDIWNQAGDYVINHMILQERCQSLQLPEGGLEDSTLGVLHTEEAYRRLFKKNPPQPGGITKPCNGQPGPGQKGQPTPGEGQGWGEVFDACDPEGKPLTVEEKKVAEQELAVATRTAMETAKRQGSLPGHMREQFDKMLETEMDWKAILAQFLSDAFKADTSFMAINRLGLVMGTRLPGNSMEDAYAQVCIGVDTSGSISQKEIEQMMSEVAHCLSEYESLGVEIELPVAYCDTAVHHEEMLAPGEEVCKDYSGGGGGTSFAPVMQWVMEMDEEPEALLYLTDGGSSDFGNDPGIPVLWILGCGGVSAVSGFAPPFGRVINLTDTED